MPTAFSHALRRTRALLLVAICGGFAASASAQLNVALNVEVPQAPAMQGLLESPVVAVGGVGNDMERTVEELVRQLSNSRFGLFTVHSRILRVSGFNVAELQRQALAAGAQTLVVVRNEGSGSESQNANRAEKTCTSRKYNASAIQQALGLDCDRWGDTTVYCTNDTHRVRASLEVMQPSSGRSLQKDIVEGLATNLNCQKTAWPNKSREVLQQEALAQYLLRLPRLVTARNVAQRIQLPLADPDLQQAGLMPRYQEAALFFNSKRTERACTDWHAVLATVPQSLAALRAVAACDASYGQYGVALKRLQQIESALRSPDAALAREIEWAQAAATAELQMASSRQDYKAAAPPQFAALAIARSAPTPAPLVANAAPAIPADSGPRVALVIGNSKYTHAGALANPVNDARDMREAMQRMGFSVVFVEDASRNQMLQAIERFGNSLSPKTHALVFYAGHGMQVKGENYLLPVDANPKTESEVELESVNLARIMAKLETAAVKIVVLDACRNDPFKRSFRSTGRGGLAGVDAPAGTLIAYATAPGQVADDGAGRNSPYSGALLKALQAPNLRVEDVFKRVRRDVAAVTRNQQIPWESSSLVGDFYFSVSNALSAPAAAGPASAAPSTPAPAAPVVAAPVVPAPAPMLTSAPVQVAPSRQLSAALPAPAPALASAATAIAADTLIPRGQDPHPDHPMSLKSQCSTRSNPIAKAICERRACEKVPLIGTPACAIYAASGN